MNILFLTLLDFKSYDEKNIYSDLLRKLGENGHNIYSISPRERKYNEKTTVIQTKFGSIIKPRIGNIQKTHFLEKGLTTLVIDKLIKYTIKKYYSDITFDLILYSTPPVTLVESIAFIKKRDNAKTYLMLKDIFPQNAVDLGLFQKEGLTSIFYHFFRNKEKQLYDVSDTIGCMSPANKDYILKHNPYLKDTNIEVFPNCIEIVDKSVSRTEKETILNKLQIPIDKTILIYGGNLGAPQGIDHMLECLKTQLENKDLFFTIVGAGTEYNKVENFIEIVEPNNVKLIKYLPKNEYDQLVGACDIGLIFLDHKFTIPNFPSRLLSYLQAKIPVFAITDSNTDIGKIIEDNRYGWWCESTQVKNFEKKIQIIQNQKLDYKMMGNNGFKYLNEHFNVEKEYKKLI